MIECRNVVKTYGKSKVLCDVSMSFDSGEIHGLVGRNGSGKTVLLKCICGLLRPTQGSVHVDGKLICDGFVLPRLGAIIETPGFLPFRSAYKNLSLLASIQKKADKAKIQDAIEKVGLDPYSRKWVSKYSMGMRQRLGIAQAIMEDPDILVLDEPMSGLDDTGVRDMRNLFLQLKAQGKTILLTSHNKEDIDELCDTVCIMDAGKLVKVR